MAIYDIFKIYIIVLGCVLGAGGGKRKRKISMGVGEGMGTWLWGGGEGQQLLKMAIWARHINKKPKN